MSRLASLFLIAAWCLWAPPAARAQDPQPDPQDVSSADAPAHISVVEGAVVLERDGRSESAPSSMPLLAGDRVRSQNGRAEILYADGSTLHLDAQTIVDFQSDEVIRLLGGRVRLNIVGPARQVSYRVDAPTAWVEIGTPGEYRISITPSDRNPQVELAVLRGAAELVNEDGRTALNAGERSFARAQAAPSIAYVFNSASWDEFDRWSESRRDSRLGVSAEYLPESVQPYASTFNDYGSWQYEQTYGYVWYPRVDIGWRPYYYGRWSTLRPWGWTWIGSDPWAWPTHHYGRWGFSGSSWFWIPGRSWGAAWVSWAYAPGYVSWCPLGWNNRAVVGFNVNGYGGGRYHDPWRAWTVVPHQGFGNGFVNTHVINASRIDAGTRGRFVVGNSAPDWRGSAMTRMGAGTPIRVAGTRPNPNSVNATSLRSRSASPGANRDGSPAGGNAAVSGRVRGTGPGNGRNVAPADGSDAAATFRSRRSGGAPLTGPGYPAPAREPRDSATVASPRQHVVGARPRNGTANVSPGSNPDSNDERRGQTSDAAPTTDPSVRGVPAPAREYRTPGYYERAEQYRAVPRNDRRDAAPGPSRDDRDNNVYSPSYGVPADRNPNRGSNGDGSDRAPRTMPRSGNDGGGPPEGYRSRPGPDRSNSGPSGPPPQSAAPSRPSAPPPPQYSAPSRSSGQPQGGNDGGGSGARSRPSGGGSGNGGNGGNGGGGARAVPRGRGR